MHRRAFLSTLLAGPAAAPFLPMSVAAEEERARRLIERCERDPLLKLRVQAEQCRRSLSRFCREAWHLIEPHRRLLWNWHHELICRHLEAVTAGDILKLIINIPPRNTKSTIVSVLWPSWVWTRRPGAQFLAAAHVGKLSMRDARKMRAIVMSPWYQRRFGDLEVVENLDAWADLEGARLTADQTAKTYFHNQAGGYRVSGSVGGGAGTGEGGDFLILDDPMKSEHAQRERRREEVNEWLGTTWSTRHNDPERSADVLIMQRQHPDDATTKLLSVWEDVVHVVLPMRFEPERAYRSHWGGDPRTEPGELLHPARFSEEVVQQLERTIVNPEAQLQQRPIARGAGKVERGMFDIIEPGEVPVRGVGWARYWDKAGTEGGKGSATAGVLVGVQYETGRVIVADVVRGRWEKDLRERTIKQTAILDRQKLGPTGPLIFLEQEPGSGGKDSLKDSIRNLSGFPAFGDRVTGTKAARAMPFVGQVRGGNVDIVRGPWNETFLRAMDNWSPTAEGEDDQIDAAGGAYNRLWDEEYMGMALARYIDQMAEIVTPDEAGGMFGGMPDDAIIGSFL